MNEYSRLEKIIGNDKLNKLRSISVLLVGIGGVGGSCLEMLIRCGINNITIVDYDIFEESNLNRQVLCTIDNIGKYKVDVAKERILSINNICNITTYNKKVNTAFLSTLKPCYNFIIDACDDLNAKIELIKYALNNDIKIISCCGTGNKLHPEMLKITNIWKTEYDPLAKKLRQMLKKEGINNKIPVISSNEQPIIKSKNYVGSISTVPNAAGILLASYVINNTIE